MSIALYRRYRPENFEEVIGQEHVTEPLMAALDAGRTTHAYLFSGPRGCGKTTSARILARCLNCEQYPTATPCGECASCRELARDGSGSLDVVELDAASHGGVDDARELREQAGFAPVRDRFKIFIIDEAHMVTNQGFNALLKLVEEPPPHVKFIFATTEPEKVIGTIRSRTHHYPFRLVPPPVLEDYLHEICMDEGVEAPHEVLSMVVRAGTGSVRDTLSVLDQIIGGSDGATLDYERAVSLLGYTSVALLDAAIDALSQVDGAALFNVVEQVVQAGHDPRRFVEDLLQRLRDLVIVALAGDSVRNVFVSVPDDQYERIVQESQAIGARRASRSADVVNEALTMMAGATAPRLQLELLCARLIVLQQEESGLRTPMGNSAAPAVPAAALASVAPAVQNVPAPAPARTPVERVVEPQDAKAVSDDKPAAGGTPSSVGIRGQVHAISADDFAFAVPAQKSVEVPVAVAAPDTVDASTAARKPAETATANAPAETAAARNASDVDRVRQEWPQILEVVAQKSVAAAGLLQNASGVESLENRVLSISFANAHWSQTFNQTFPALDAVAYTVFELTGLKTLVRGVVAPAGEQGEQGDASPKA